MEAGSIEAIVATAVDGATAQGSCRYRRPEGRSGSRRSGPKRVCRCLEWRARISPPDRDESHRRRTGYPTLAASLSYLDRIVAHELALSIENGKRCCSASSRSPKLSAAPIGNPRAWPLVKRSPGRSPRSPRRCVSPPTLAPVLRKSNKLAELEAVAQSWFEDDPQAAQAVERAHGRDRAKLAHLSIAQRHCATS